MLNGTALMHPKLNTASHGFIKEQCALPPDSSNCTPQFLPEAQTTAAENAR
jgi:hypothetical protein